MLKPVSHKADIPYRYQQALDDFGISELLNKLNNHCDADFNSAWVHLEAAEAETLAALLIGQLTKNLTGKVITDYLNLLRNNNQAVTSDLPAVELHSLQAITLPENFPQNSKTPLFWIGDRIRWKIINNKEQTDFGIVIGKFYAYARHRASWEWKYLIWLDP
ncbi:hypothetical protein, partial [Floridanema evergladense]